MAGRHARAAHRDDARAAGASAEQRLELARAAASGARNAPVRVDVGRRTADSRRPARGPRLDRSALAHRGSAAPRARRRADAPARLERGRSRPSRRRRRRRPPRGTKRGAAQRGVSALDRQLRRPPMPRIRRRARGGVRGRASAASTTAAPRSRRCPRRTRRRSSGCRFPRLPSRAANVGRGSAADGVRRSAPARRARSSVEIGVARARDVRARVRGAPGRGIRQREAAIDDDPSGVVEMRAPAVGASISGLDVIVRIVTARGASSGRPP